MASQIWGEFPPPQPPKKWGGGGGNQIFEKTKVKIFSLAIRSRRESVCCSFDHRATIGDNTKVGLVASELVSNCLSACRRLLGLLLDRVCSNHRHAYRFASYIEFVTPVRALCACGVKKSGFFTLALTLTSSPFSARYSIL